ncbi:MAG: SIMPL domain-containing protein [Treponema sp.]|nr:SIMPL domain-containing protein [Treponema sp.]
MKKSHFFFNLLFIVLIILFGCKTTNKYNQSTISVFGTDTVLVQPDVIQMRITLSNTAGTTKMAQDEVSRMVRQALSILNDAGIEEKNIMTASLSFRSEYDYSNRRILIGQRAEQSITFSVDDIDNNSERVSEIIDNLIQINGIELNQMNFSVNNNTDYYIRSRELAYQKALEKATQYAELSNLKIIRVLNISENINQYMSPTSNRFLNNSMDFSMATRQADSATIVPMGELEITTTIFIEYLLE